MIWSDSHMTKYGSCNTGQLCESTCECETERETVCVYVRAYVFSHAYVERGFMVMVH